MLIFEKTRQRAEIVRVGLIWINNNKLSGEFISRRCETKNGIFSITKTFFVREYG